MYDSSCCVGDVLYALDISSNDISIYRVIKITNESYDQCGGIYQCIWIQDKEDIRLILPKDIGRTVFRNPSEVEDILGAEDRAS